MDETADRSATERTIAADLLASRRAAILREMKSLPEASDLGTDELVLDRIIERLVTNDPHRPPDETPAISSSSVSSLREIFRDEVVDALDAPSALQVTLCLSSVLDDLLAESLEAEAATLERLAYLDPLTALGNRRAAEAELRSAVATATRYDRRLAVVMADLDGLKLVNDLEGHDAGDRMLRSMADALVAAMRRGDHAFRVGGDEFVLVLAETEADEVAEVMRRVRDAGAPSFSYGSAALPVDGSDPDELLQVADQRLLAWRREARRTAEPVRSTNHALPLTLAGAVLVLAAVASLLLAH